MVALYSLVMVIVDWIWMIELFTINKLGFRNRNQVMDFGS